MVRTQRAVAACVGAAILVSASFASAAERAARAREADSLHRVALEHLGRGTLDARLQAMDELERASLLDPSQYRVWLDLGRLCLETNNRRRGRACYERAKQVAPDDAEAYAALGTAWKWEWLNSFEASALARAQEETAHATGRAPQRVEAWSELSVLSLARGRLAEAARAAEHGRAADSSAWQPWVALGCVAYRCGDLALAERAFAAARARGPQDFCPRVNRFLPGYEQDEIVTSWWSIPDPDLTTVENEAELDYLTRLGLALLLFRDARGLRWDMRTELFVRYGPPAGIVINPNSSPLETRMNRYYFDHPDQKFYGPPPMAYPYNVQAWVYPELGIHIELWDRSLTQSFQLPVSMEEEADPRPHPGLLAGRPELVSVDQGRGVFRSMPPGARPVEAWGQISRFPSEEGTVLLGHLVTAGDPADTLFGAWAVRASDGTVVVRGSGALTPSACDPAGRRVADFTVVLPPDDYRIDLSVRGSGNRRGLVRLGATVLPAPPGLHLSDLVLLCSMADASVSPEVVRIEPDLDRRVGGDGPFAVYFEIDHLTAGDDGRARFAYTTALHRVEKDGTKPGRAPAYEASREESHDGTRRRQFVTIPMRSIKRGVYELRIEVRDLVAGTRATTGLRFERE